MRAFAGAVAGFASMAAFAASCGIAAGPAQSHAGVSTAAVVSASAVRASRVTIDRDEFGVPYIVGTNELDVAYGVAYAMAEDGFHALEDAYASALGQASAYYGSARAEGDRLRSALRVRPRATEELAAMPASERALLQAFADGLNAYVRDHPREPPRHFGRFEPWMVVAYANDVAWVQATERVTAIRADTSQRVTLAVTVRRRDDASILLVASRDALPYEMNIRTADGFAFHAFTTLGLPFAREGFSENVAYAASEPDLRSSVVPVEMSKNSPSIRVAHTDTLRLNTERGVERVAVTSMQSVDGPVVAMRSDTAFVLRERDVPRGVLHDMHAMMHASDKAALTSIAPGRAMRGSADRIDNRDAVVAERSVSVFAPGRQASAEALLRADTAWTIQNLIRLAFDTRAGAAEHEIASLVDEWEQVGARNPEKAQVVDSAVAILRNWNRTSTVESTAMTLYADFMLALESQSAGSYRRFSALEAVVTDPRRFPARPWGAVNAVKRENGMIGALGSGVRAMPVAGAPLRTSTLFTYDARSSDQFYVWAVDLRSGVAGSVLSYGSSHNPASPHWFDQAPLFAAGSLKPASVRGAGSGHPYHPGESH